MKYNDFVYGEFKIAEPVILDLISSPALQRLKGVDQAGYSCFWAKPDIDFSNNKNSRFAHSLGVCLLLRKYGAPIEEQIAGLIHDVSHSAFSHCIDYILDEGSQKTHDHQDNIFDDYVKNKTNIPEIISKHGFDLEFILNDNNFPLKEKNLPDLCADRIDYSLKTAILFNELNNENKKYFLENLTAQNNEWVFRNFESAKKYAQLFSRINRVYYSNFFPTAVMFRTVGDCLRHALDRGYISRQDLYRTDDFVLEKVANFLGKDARLKLLWDRMQNVIKADNNPEDYDAEVFCKSRVVDPLFAGGRGIRRVSDEEPEWKKIVEEESKPKVYYIKFRK